MTERHNAGNVQSVAKQKLRAEDSRKQQEKDLRTLLEMPEFRRYVWRHLNETCGLLKSAANPNGSIQSINIGMQDAARALWVEIEATNPLAIPQMMREHHEAVTEREKS